MKVGYKGTIKEFLENGDKVVSDLTAYGRTFCVLRDQGQAWVKEVDLLREALTGGMTDGRIYFEYDIPRMAKRADVILLVYGILFVIEFKVSLLPGEHDQSYDAAGIDQVDDYAHDFAYFHSKSHLCPIVPILIDNAAVDCHDEIQINDYAVYKVVRCNSAVSLRELIDKANENIPKDYRLSAPYLDWEEGVYEPTPTIVEAAEALYANHTVEEITRSGAGAEGIRNATVAINEIIVNAKKNNQKVICFLTGVPGAGKTLVGMNLIASRDGASENRVFLSGNYPLVKVLQEALIRNRMRYLELLREKVRAGGDDRLTPEQESQLNGYGLVLNGNKTKGRLSRKSVVREVCTKLQLVAHFRSGYDEGPEAPNEHVFVFDESQRAWSAEKLRGDEKRTDGLSEPDILLSYLDRHSDWCVAVALVGVGQDIHDGEAGISEWYRALAGQSKADQSKFEDWHIYIASEDCDENFSRMKMSHSKPFNIDQHFHIDPRLYLDHPMRSFRAKDLSDFVEALLRGREGLEDAKRILVRLNGKGEDGRVLFPIHVCRDLEKAKSKLRTMAVGTERYGTLISARAKRLRHYGMFSLGQDFDQIAWFLDSKDSIDSSYSMEVAASEFKIQGLEIDYAIVGWDGDFTFDTVTGKFKCQNFRTAMGRWEEITGKEAETKKRYLINAYRVLLTRARQGMIIFVPTGDVTGRDATVPTSVYNSTYDFLKSVGISEL